MQKNYLYIKTHDTELQGQEEGSLSEYKEYEIHL